MTWDTDDLDDGEIITQDGTFAYLFTASGNLYAGQAVKINADDTVVATSASDDGIGIVAANTDHGDKLGVYCPGNIVYAVIDGTHAAGTALYAGDDGIMTNTRSSTERIMAFVIEAGSLSSTNYKAKVLLV